MSEPKRKEAGCLSPHKRLLICFLLTSDQTAPNESHRLPLLSSRPERSVVEEPAVSLSGAANVPSADRLQVPVFRQPPTDSQDDESVGV